MKYAIQSQFLAIPNLRFTRNLWRLRCFSFLVKLTRLFYKWDGALRVQKHTVTSTDGYRFKVIEISPKTLAAEAPALLYFHGGAFFLSYAASHFDQAQMYALQANCRVFIVDYRLSTKAAFPASFNDSYAALQWLHSQAQTLQIDSQRIVVGGDSAGGCLAAVVTQKALDESLKGGGAAVPLAGQMLVYPVTDCESKTPSARQFVDTPVWRTEYNKLMWDVLLRDHGFNSAKKIDVDNLPAYASPIHRENLAGLPPAYIEASEFDPLRDEAVNYAQALGAAGVDVSLKLVKGGVHAYDFIDCDITKKYKKARVNALIKFFEKEPMPD